MEKHYGFSRKSLDAQAIEASDRRRVLIEESESVLYRIVDRVIKYFNERKSRQ